MNTHEMDALFAICSAPVIDAPLAIAVTPMGRQTLRAHNRPVPVVRHRTAVVPSTCEFDRCPHCDRDYLLCECDETAAEIAAHFDTGATVDTTQPDPAVQHGMDKALRALFGDDYPTLAERP